MEAKSSLEVGMKEKLIKLIYWLVENNDELRARAIRILAARDIAVIANMGIHGDLYYPKHMKQKVIVNNYIVANYQELNDNFFGVFQEKENDNS